MSSTAVEVFQQGLDLLVARDMNGFVDLFAEDAVVEYAFAPPGWPQQLHGRAQVQRQLGDFPAFLEIQRVEDLTVHETTDPEVVVAEFTLAGVVTATGEPYASRYIEVVTVRGGRFVHYRDYWNPMLALDLMPHGHGSH
ncbi:nuclear transport factor 2 family protein [Quadrisphaera sp. DSM 44207]|uniref:nuclear transport factor 2 family protein n=1 Tax=Quadrisphaera sp. DSM 44207 TaxID=1881057 RepID=UPI00088850CC|nr:nuclear transport factor 2 family protein [Quadrisphaera sp. DSM 44207]SDQ04086.1 Ketosteroid isomerase-related protein [Quadrisphaera sp. DSM 44207]